MSLARFESITSSFYSCWNPFELVFELQASFWAPKIPSVHSGLPRASEEAFDKLKPHLRPRKVSYKTCDNSRLEAEAPTRKPPTIRFRAHRKTFTSRLLHIWLPKKPSAKSMASLEIPAVQVSAKETSQSSEELVDVQLTGFWTYRPVHERLSRGVLFPYDVSKIKAATYTEFSSLGCATPSGFLNLLASYSALIRTALFHAESVPGVTALRGFPLPVAATTFAALYPFSLDRALRAPFPLRSEERGFDVRPIRHHLAPGFMHLGGPFSTRRCYPTPPVVPLSAFVPLRGFLPSSLGLSCEKPPLMGFPITLDESIVMAALQSVKELKSHYSLSRAATLHGVRALGTKPKFFGAP